MPTISQLPAAAPVSASDELPISQGGSVCAVLVGDLLISAQPAITVQSPSLIGRASLGSGGPEQIDVGVGLNLSGGTVVATGADHALYPSTQGLLTGADLVISNQGSQMLMATDLLRGLFSAGNNITIDANGVIGALVEGTIAPTALLGSAIGALEVVSSVSAADLVPVSQAGADHAIAYSNFLNGLTINEAPAAVPVASSDSLWVAQGTNIMASQSFGAIWSWVAGLMPSYTAPVLEIQASCSLQTNIHNGRILVCSQPVTLTPALGNLTSGFQCQVINASSENVTLGTGFVTSTGSFTLGAGQSAAIQCVTYSGGTMVYVSMPQAVASVGSPGQVTGVSATNVSAASMTLSWQVPSTGGIPASYILQFRITGTTSWTTESLTGAATSYQVTGLQPSTSYDFEVQAINAGGTGPSSSVLTVSTAASTPVLSAPPQVTGLTAVAQSSTVVELAWTSQTGTNAASSYTVQYRITGSTVWSSSVASVTQNTYSVSGLQASTSYDFSVFGVSAGGQGIASAVVSVATPATVVAAPGQVVGVSATATSSAAIVVSWSAQTGTNAASTYTLQYRVTGSTAWSSSVTGLTQTSYTVSGLQASTGYDFSLIGVNAGGTGPVSAVVSASTLAAPIAVPGQVIGVSASPSSSSAIVVAWTGQSGSNAASTYTVQYRITGSTAWSSSVAGITQNSYTVSGLQASTSYDFSVFGVNAGGPGVVSAVASASTMAVVISAPGQVTGVTASVSSSTQIVVSWSGQIGTNAATSYTLQYRQTGTTTWGSSIPGITGDSYSVTGLTAATSYDFSILGVNAGGTGPASATISAVTQAAGSSVSSITWNVPPSGTYTHGSGAIGVNAHVTPSSAAVQFGFSTSVTVEPTSWTSGGLVNTNLWGAYVPTPATAGTWYAWVEGTDGSCPTVYPTGFVVQ